MIFHSRRNYRTTGDPAVVSGAWLGKCVILIPVLSLAFVIYALCDGDEPPQTLKSKQS